LAVAGIIGTNEALVSQRQSAGSDIPKSFVVPAAGYIRVFQDVRGKYKSDGDYVMTRPVRGPLNPATTDHVTDAYDTIDWLVKNTPESNGRVGMIGSSYEGFTVVMALLGPHPALKVAAPESPMVDGWMGDDWFHYGAFRQVNLDYVSDPAKPVPYVPRPVRFEDSDRWKTWLVTDQRAVADRTDVLTYQTPALGAPIRIGGASVASLFAATSGTDCDWVVKLIDVFPDEVPSQPELGGYQLAVSMDIFRGRYRDSFERPSPVPAGKPQQYRFALPTTNHVFLAGHRIMVQIQSSWFPLYDRNPQTYVENIFFARPADYVKATQTVFRSAEQPSAVWLPVAP
jgi:predicted acyl esterase